MNQSSLPKNTGIGLKPQHYELIIQDKPNIGWFEIHPENYFGKGGPAHFYLEQIAKDYPLSMHGVGLSLGSASGLNQTHLNHLKELNNRYQPAAFSEHLSWCENNNQYFNDLLPLPYSEESLNIFIQNTLKAQDFLKRPILIENPSIYIQTPNQMSEIEFIKELIKKTDCGLLLDINNVFVSAFNLGFNPQEYLDQYPAQKIKEIHLAGHSDKTLDNIPVKIDDHGSKVSNEVWTLYQNFIEKNGAIATQIEWDTNTPDLDTWLEEAKKSQTILNKCVKEEV